MEKKNNKLNIIFSKAEIKKIRLTKIKKYYIINKKMKNNIEK